MAAARRIIASTSTPSQPSATPTSASISLQHSFESASAYLQSSTDLSLSNELKLHLYALYKIATCSPRPSTARPGIFDFTARAKWDSWNALGSSNPLYEKGDEESRTNAMEAYIEKAIELGWKPEKHTNEAGEVLIPAEEMEPNTATSGKGKTAERAGKGGMVSVSMMLQDDDEDSDSLKSPLHELAIQGDPTDLENYLSENKREPKFDVDQVDAYGFAPIHLATDRGHTELVKILLRYGADKGLLDEDGNTPLQLAELAGHDDIIELLRSK